MNRPPFNAAAISTTDWDHEGDRLDAVIERLSRRHQLVETPVSLISLDAISTTVHICAAHARRLSTALHQYLYPPYPLPDQEHCPTPFTLLNSGEGGSRILRSLEDYHDYMEHLAVVPFEDIHISSVLCTLRHLEGQLETAHTRLRRFA